MTLGWTVGKAPLVGSRTGTANLPSPPGAAGPSLGAWSFGKGAETAPRGLLLSQGREKETSGFYFRFPP